VGYVLVEFALFVVLILFALFMLFVFMYFLCSNVPEVCSLQIVREGFALLLWIVLALVVVGIVYFVLVAVWEHTWRTLLADHRRETRTSSRTAVPDPSTVPSVRTLKGRFTS